MINVCSRFFSLIRLPGAMLAFTLFMNSCEPKKEVTSDVAVYQEPYRPQYHFTPAAGWMNDPNGMVFYEGEYHLFYQHYPDSTVWGPMHWGHAVSHDMVRWEHLPIALYPDSIGLIFSGSVVIDWNNTSGFGTEENPPMVAIFTYHNMDGERAGRIDFQTQGIAFSTDKGRTWTKFEQNPVLKNPGIRDFRDPKVSWHQDTQQWVMALAVKDHVEFYGSPNLKQWNKLSDFGNLMGNHNGVWECPDLFMLKDGEGKNRWVLLVSINPGGPQGGSATQYFVGDFDGKNFTAQDTITRWIDYGADNYAGVTWSDVPVSDGRRLFLGWMSNWQYANVVPTEAWRSAMTVPRELVLKKKGAFFELASRPVSELNTIKELPVQASGTAQLSSNHVLLSFDLHDDEGDFTLQLSNDNNENLVLMLRGGLLSIDRMASGMVTFNQNFPAIHTLDVRSLTVQSIDVYLDASSIELFVNDGERVMTDLVFPTVPYNRVTLEKKNPSFSISNMTSIWNLSNTTN